MSSSDSSIAAAARWYAPEAMVPTVPITPIRPVRVVRFAARSPGSITPVTGTVTYSRRWSSAAAEALLHAMTIILTLRAINTSAISVEYFKTSVAGFGPYGNRPVSPK